MRVDDPARSRSAPAERPGALGRSRGEARCRAAAFGARSRIGLAVLGLLAAPGCAEELPRFGSLRYQGDDFEVWASEGLVACEGTHAYTEAWLAAFRERLGPHARPQYHVFNWVNDEDLAAAPCSTRAACAASEFNVIYSNRIPHEHEVVHVELDFLDTPAFVSEGAAEAFGTGLAPTRMTTGSVSSLLEETPTIPIESYPAAGRFTRYLLDTYGIDTYFEIAQGFHRGQSLAGVEGAFEGVLGEPLDAIFEDFESYPACPAAAWRTDDYECSVHPLTPWADADHWATTAHLTCESDEAIGPQGDRFWAIRAFEVAEAGKYELSAKMSEGTTFELVSCAWSCFDSADGTPRLASSLSDLDRLPLMLEPGRYWIRIEAEVGSAAAVTLSLDRTG